MTAYAQNSAIHGTIADSKGRPLTDVYDTVAETKAQFFSDPLGHFHFDAAIANAYHINFSRKGLHVEKVLKVKSDEEHVNVVIQSD